MWDELNVYQTLTTDLKVQQNYRDEFRVTEFPSGLNSELAPLSPHILSGKEVPTIGEAFARVRHTHTHTRSRNSFSERGGRRGGRGTKKCTHCGATNHDVEFCWKLHGKPVSANQATLEPLWCNQQKVDNFSSKTVHSVILIPLLYEQLFEAISQIAHPITKGKRLKLWEN